MTRWMSEKSVGFTDVGLLKILESVRAYAYLILGSQASARSGIVGNTASALTAQSAFLDNFENVVNRRVDIREDIIHLLDSAEPDIRFVVQVESNVRRGSIQQMFYYAEITE